VTVNPRTEIKSLSAQDTSSFRTNHIEPRIVCVTRSMQEPIPTASPNSSHPSVSCHATDVCWLRTRGNSHRTDRARPRPRPRHVEPRLPGPPSPADAPVRPPAPNPTGRSQSGLGGHRTRHVPGRPSSVEKSGSGRRVEEVEEKRLRRPPRHPGPFRSATYAERRTVHSAGDLYPSLRRGGGRWRWRSAPHAATRACYSPHHSRSLTR
jgi:hypothetical protein